jgi:hypothetical protein
VLACQDLREQPVSVASCLGVDCAVAVIDVGDESPETWIVELKIEVAALMLCGAKVSTTFGR